MIMSVVAAALVDDGGILSRIPRFSTENGWRISETLAHVNCGSVGMTHPDKPGIIACGKCQLQTADTEFFDLVVQEC